MGKWFLIAAMLGTSPVASAQLFWSTQVQDEHQQGTGHGGGHGHGGPVGYYLRDGAGATAGLWLPTLEQRPLQIAPQDGRAAVRPSGVEYYHALVASRESEGLSEGAVRYISLRGKPSGHSPSELLVAAKLPLEVVPDPLPREHGRYQSRKLATFLVRADGKPLAGRTVALETSHGTRLFANTDAEGRVTFSLPEDFPQIGAGRSANRPGEFRVSVSHRAEGGHRYRTALSADYHVNPDNWQSGLGGKAAALAGFLVGLGVLGFAGRKGARG